MAKKAYSPKPMTDVSIRVMDDEEFSRRRIRDHE